MNQLLKMIAGLLVAVALALVAYAWFLSRQPVPAPRTAQPVVALHSVVVTARAVPNGQPLVAEDLKIAQLPVNPNGAFRETSAVIGRVPVLDLGVDAPVLAPQLSSGLAARVGEGERAVAIKVDETSAVGHRVRPGDFVDVFLTLKRDNLEVGQSQARLLLSRRRVLAYGAGSIDGAATTPASAQAAAQARAEPGRTAVLAVAVDEVNALNLAEAHGRLSLVLRNPSDTATGTDGLLPEPPPLLATAAQARGASRGAAPLAGVDRALAGVSLDALVHTGAAPSARPQSSSHVPPPLVARSPSPSAAAAARPAGATIEVIRGTRVENVQP
ncbi:MAG: Flp pilus assembly protein CpaB [Burkholderiales bacterium]|jgi:pilus assembly protein CpaB|nr:Flp pilus assembly protein CpaB [Burkholderiales bacterium]